MCDNVRGRGVVRSVCHYECYEFQMRCGGRFCGFFVARVVRKVCLWCLLWFFGWLFVRRACVSCRCVWFFLARCGFVGSVVVSQLFLFVGCVMVGLMS